MVPGKPEALSFWGGGVVGERRKYRKSAFSFTWLTLSGTLIALGSGLYGLMDIVYVLAAHVPYRSHESIEDTDLCSAIPVLSGFRLLGLRVYHTTQRTFYGSSRPHWAPTCEIRDQE